MDISYYKKMEPFWGVWYIDKELGAGSYGRVFKIKRDDFGETYTSALKIISVPNDPSETDSLRTEGMDEDSISKYYETFTSELIKEFSLMAKIKGHSNIVSYEDHMTIKHEDGIGYDILIRMELLTPLNAYLKGNTITEDTIISLGMDICRALEVCSKQNIIHRDIKPENVFVSSLGSFKLGDFGVSRIAENATQGMSVKGTVSFMAPEVFKCQPYNATVDIYSLGIMLYKLSNNNRGPFLPPVPEIITYSDREKAENLRMNGTTLPDSANASKAFMSVIRKAASYDSKDRYQTPTQMREALEALLSHNGKVEAVSDTSEPEKEEVSTLSTGISPNTTDNKPVTQSVNEDFSIISDDASIYELRHMIFETKDNETVRSSLGIEDKPESKKKFTDELREKWSGIPESFQPWAIVLLWLFSLFVAYYMPYIIVIVLLLIADIGAMVINHQCRNNILNNKYYCIRTGLLTVKGKRWFTNINKIKKYLKKRKIVFDDTCNDRLIIHTENSGKVVLYFSSDDSKQLIKITYSGTGNLDEVKKLAGKMDIYEDGILNISVIPDIKKRKTLFYFAYATSSDTVKQGMSCMDSYNGIGLRNNKVLYVNPDLLGMDIYYASKAFMAVGTLSSPNKGQADNEKCCRFTGVEGRNYTLTFKSDKSGTMRLEDVSFASDNIYKEAIAEAADSVYGSSENGSVWKTDRHISYFIESAEAESSMNSKAVKQHVGTLYR